MLLMPKSRSLSHHRTHRGSSNSHPTSSNTPSGSEDIHHRDTQMTGGDSATMHSLASGNKDTEQPHLITTTWLLRVCKLLNLVTGLASILGIVAHVSVLSVPAPPADVALRLYGILLCILSIITECEWTRFFGWISVLGTWIGRGLNNVLCGVLVLVFEEATVPDEGDNEAMRPRVFRSFAGHFLVAVGVIYVVGGVLCLQRVKERHVSKLRKRDQALVQKQELETRKQEIELLLRDTESQLEKI